MRLNHSHTQHHLQIEWCLPTSCCNVSWLVTSMASASGPNHILPNGESEMVAAKSLPRTSKFCDVQVFRSYPSQHVWGQSSGQWFMLLVECIQVAAYERIWTVKPGSFILQKTCNTRTYVHTLPLSTGGTAWAKHPTWNFTQVDCCIPVPWTARSRSRCVNKKGRWGHHKHRSTKVVGERPSAVYLGHVLDVH